MFVKGKRSPKHAPMDKLRQFEAWPLGRSLLGGRQLVRQRDLLTRQRGGDCLL